MGLMGGIDKRALTHGEDAIRRELEYKIGSIVGQGGYIPFIAQNPEECNYGTTESPNTAMILC